jgi:hypothetical protein
LSENRIVDADILYSFIPEQNMPVLPKFCVYVSHQDGNTRIGASAQNNMSRIDLLRAQASSQQKENKCSPCKILLSVPVLDSDINKEILQRASSTDYAQGSFELGLVLPFSCPMLNGPWILRWIHVICIICHV